MLLASAIDNAPAFAISPETVLAGGVLILGFVAAQFRFRGLAWWERPLARLARHRKLAILVAILAPMLLRAALLPWFPIRAPRVHDEFSFLLQADTLAHGRLVNARHPFWVHFESEHILVSPVYASVFPIAQAAAIAAGQALFGIPWAGVWLSAGLMCGAICWMLQGWLPPRWALLGALLVVLRLGVSSYWMNSYWGGCVAAIGGALVLGALPRILAQPGWRHAVAMGAGWMILANSRTFEGGVISLLVSIWLFVRLFGRTGPPKAVAMRQVGIPLLIMLALTTGIMGYYFARVTGKPWVAPYVLYRSTETVAPHFIWQKPRLEPLYNNRELRHFYVDQEMHDYRLARESPWESLWGKLGAYWRFYIGPILVIPLLAVPWLWRDRKTRPLLWIAAAFFLALAGQVWHNAHYAAPATGLTILIVVLGMRQLRLWRWRGRPVGLYLVRCLLPASAVLLLIQVIAGQLPEGTLEQPSWRWTSPGGVTRANMQQQLAGTGERHLVMVRYGINHEAGDEWVYNSADIDAAPVIWARELDRNSNEKLLGHFSARKIWLIEPDAPRPRLIPYHDSPTRAMPFVQLGAPGIETLRSPDDIRQKVRDRAAGTQSFTCDQWNYWFTETTGVQGPATGPECYESPDRNHAVGFDHWFSWLRQQR
jgi:hypothetical protein